MFVEEILRTMDTALNRIHICLDSLSEDQVWCRLKPNMNSIGNLCVHLAGNEYQHFVSGIGERPLVRQRTLEFTSDRGYSKNELKELLNQTRNESKSILNNLIEQDLDRQVKVMYSLEDWNRMKERSPEETDPWYSRSIQVILFQVCEHYGYHTGQIVLLTKLIKDIEGSITGYKH
ncbi:DinB family protein [Paenibacillus tarimensis]